MSPNPSVSAAPGLPCVSWCVSPYLSVHFNSNMQRVYHYSELAVVISIFILFLHLGFMISKPQHKSCTALNWLKPCWIYMNAVCLEALPYFSPKNLFRLHKRNRQEPMGFHLVVLPLFCLASQLSIDPKVRLLFVARPKWQPPTLTMLLSSYHLSYRGHIVMLWQCC